MIGIVNGCREQKNYEKWLTHFGLSYIIVDDEKKLENISCAVFCGGADFGKRPERDLFEKNIYLQCKLKEIPVIGICRGMQLVCMLEGSQIVDLADHQSEYHCADENKKSRWHNISFTNGDSFRVNSRHHQRVLVLPNLFHTIGYDEYKIPEPQHVHLSQINQVP